MKSLLKSKKGLSTVITTLIILVVSVLLATVVTYYAINMTTTRVQEENLRVIKAHVWANSCYYERNATAPIGDLAYLNATTFGTQAGDDLSLKSGEYMTMYIDSPGTISVGDVGVTCSLTVFTASAQYKVEVNVESAS